MKRALSALLASTAALALLPSAAQAQSDARELNLATFDKAWQLVYDRYWDENFGGVDWLGLKDELRPKAAEAETRRELRGILRDMVGRLGQSHFGVIPGRGSGGGGGELGKECTLAFSERLQDLLQSEVSPGDAGPGFVVRFVEGTARVTHVDEGGPAARAGVEPGWEVARIGAQPVDAVLPCLGGDLPERTKRNLVHDIVTNLLLGDEGDKIEVVFENSAGRKKKRELELVIPADAQVVKFGNLPPMQFRFRGDWAPHAGGNFGVIRFNNWMMPAAPLFEQAVVEMSRAEGIVIDLRGNPGGVAGLSAGFAGYFGTGKETLGTLKTRRDELKLQINPRLVLRNGSKFEPYQGPVAILIDQFSGSTSEIFAAGMQDLERARIFGETSMGAALPATIEELPNGDYLMHPIADLLRPSGERVEGDGVVPDEEVPLTVDGLQAGRDEPLEAALEWLRAQQFDPAAGE